MSLIDSHIHLDDSRFNGVRCQMIADAHRANVHQFIVPAIAQQWWPRLRDTCRQYPNTFACYGLHPCFMDQHQEAHLQQLSDWVRGESPVAIGECGLDYFIANSDPAAQRHFFQFQVQLAQQFQLPIVIHARKAMDDVLKIIRNVGHHRGVIHSFSGSLQQAQQAIDLGYFIGLGGAMTYPRALKLQRIAVQIPLDRLLLETDAPDQINAFRKEAINQPGFLHDVWQFLADIRQETAEEIAAQTTANAIQLFGLPTFTVCRD